MRLIISINRIILIPKLHVLGGKNPLRWITERRRRASQNYARLHPHVDLEQALRRKAQITKSHETIANDHEDFSTLRCLVGPSPYVLTKGTVTYYGSNMLPHHLVLAQARLVSD